MKYEQKMNRKGVLYMSFEQVESFILSVGFPILCCIALGWYIYKRDQKYEQIIERMNLKHEQEIEKIKNSLDNNTKVMTELTFYLKGGGIGEQSIQR